MLRNSGFVIVAAMLVASCGSAPLAPTPVVSAPVIVPLPLALAGQSNADFMRPALATAYAPGLVTGFAQNGSRIQEWDAGTAYWTNLQPSLHQPIRAFVWWQGESDRGADDAPVYAAKLRAFLARVRQEAHDPHLLIVLCRVVNDPVFASIRQTQEAYVVSDPRAILVSSDGLPLEFEGSAHLSPAGYASMSQRILDALRDKG